MCYYILIFHKKDSKNLVIKKFRNKLNLLQCKFFYFFSFKIYVDACYVFECYGQGTMNDHRMGMQ